MFLFIFLALFVGGNGRELIEPKFQVLTPDELMVEVPHYEAAKLVTFRIGVRRAGQDEDDLELGENDIGNNRVFIYDPRLKLKKGDAVNYLFAFRDKGGYQAQSGVYHFNGVYYKKPFSGRQRFRRHVLITTEDPYSNVEFNTQDTEGFNPVEPRFGGGRGGGFYPHHGGHWPNHGHRNHGFNPFGPPRGNPFPGNTPTYGGIYPNFGSDCNDHRHDRCHGHERWQGSTEIPSGETDPSVEDHCKICKSQSPPVVEVTTKSQTAPTTTEDMPDIDIRFSN